MKNILFVADQTTQECAKQGGIYVGAQKVFLHEVLSAYVSPEHVFFCPRDDVESAVKKSRPFVVVLTGPEAVRRYYGPKTVVKHVRGFPRWADTLEAFLLPTYSVPYVFAYPEFAADFYIDIQKAVTLAENGVRRITPPDPVLHEILSPEDLTEAVKIALETPTDGVCAVDIETSGLDFFKDEILSIGFGPAERDVYIFGKSAIENPSVCGYLTWLFENNFNWVFQNGKFDVEFLRFSREGKECIIPTARCDFDTMLAHFCIDERPGTHGLKQWAREFYNAPDWEAAIALYTKHGGSYADIPEAVLHRYQAFDVYYTRKGYYTFSKMMKDEGTEECFYNIYMPALQHFVQLELSGVRVDVEALKKAVAEAPVKIEKTRKKLEAEAISAGWKGPFNPKSIPQICTVAYSLLRTPSTYGRTCDRAAIERWKGKYPFWRALDEYREASNLFETFLRGMLERVDPDGRIRPDFLLHGARTGRIASVNPNLQNLPSTGHIKEFFLPDDEDSVIVNADYKTLEVVTAAYLAGDAAMLEPFMRHEDFHWNTVQGVFPEEVRTLETAVTEKDSAAIRRVLAEPIHHAAKAQAEEALEKGAWNAIFPIFKKHLRRLTKFITFGVMYGRGAKSLADNELHCTITEAEQYVQKFFEHYKSYRQFLNAQEKMAKSGFVRTVFGFKRRFPLVTMENWHKVKNRAWNTPVQSTAAHICLRALVRTSQRLTEKGLGRVLWTVHDSIVFSVPKKRFSEAVDEIYSGMTQNIFSDAPEGLFDVDIEAGPNYGSLRPVKKVGGTWVLA